MFATRVLLVLVLSGSLSCVISADEARPASALSDGNQNSSTEPELPKMKALPSDLKPFGYIDVGPRIPNYAAGRGETLNLMQQPASAKESIKHIVTPEGFHVELFADESMSNGLGDGGKMFEGKPVAMNWDAQGRLWVCETLDYPNELKAAGKGRDRIRVLTDNDGDGRADRSVVFAEELSIPTAIAFHRGGVIVQNGVETLYMKDTDSDGKADVRKILISNWSLGDTHGGVSNFRNGLDNWIWAMQGYNNSSPIIDGKQIPTFRMGFFRFKLSQDDDPKVEQFEFLRSTTNNTWGLGISEEGLIFGSTANRQPSFFMPIANRYYERVNGWAPETLQMICPTHMFDPITEKVRQVDHHGGYTAAAGHAIYTARNYPAAYWNRTAFVCGPTGKLVGTFVIRRDGAGMQSEGSTNLFASTDEWTAPIMAEVGPDGNVWVLDWYNYVVQHNPVPQGFEKGKGNAYETDLRDKKFGRIYRVVPDVDRSDSAEDPDRAHRSRKLTASSSTSVLVSALRSPTMLVRLHAQRLLVERGDPNVLPQLVRLIDDRTIDEIGLNVGAIHALHTLDGLRLLRSKGAAVDATVRALSHPSAGVRLNAVRVIPDAQAVDAIIKSNLIEDADHHVVMAALLKLSDVKSENAGAVVAKAASTALVRDDRWLNDALVSAGAMHATSFFGSLLGDGRQLDQKPLASIARISEHFARSRPNAQAIVKLFSEMTETSGNANDSIIIGLSRGWPKDHPIKLGVEHDATIRGFFEDASPRAKGMLASLAPSLSSAALKNAITPMLNEMMNSVKNTDETIERRISAASQLVELSPGRAKSVDVIVDLIGPQSPTALSKGLIAAIGKSTIPGLGRRLVEIGRTGTPMTRDAALQMMLSRADLTNVLLTSIKEGRLRFSDLSAQQRAALRSHPTLAVRRRTRNLMNEIGMVTDSNRQELVRQKMTLATRIGDAERGKAIFTKNCATCHVFKGEGNVVGPNLNGMSVHPKAELLIHILDPNRSVEANYRLYNVLTADGEVISGLLSGETLTSIEMVDSQGKRHTVLREDIDQLNASKNSAMPEGIEQTVNDDGLVDLLEYLTQSEPFIPLGLENVANVLTTEGMFTQRENARERLVLPGYGAQVVEGVPFHLIDPDTSKNEIPSIKNAIMLHGPLGPFAPQMPKSTTVRCKVAAERIHVLGGIAGWGARSESDQGVSMIVRLRYADGAIEDHPLISGQHIADYIGIHHVPESNLAIKAADGGQVRYLSIAPIRNEVIDSIDLVKPDHKTAPVILAITAELKSTRAIPNRAAQD